MAKTTGSISKIASPPWNRSSPRLGSKAPAADPFYNPSWSHRIGLLPQVNFAKRFFARARLFLSQEFTHSDFTTYRNEIEPSDLSFDVGTSGYKEDKSGIRISGDVRFGLPTSKLSQTQTRRFSIGPSLAISRGFQVRSGLSLAYFARGTYRFNGATNRENASPRIGACATPLECLEFQSSGARNPRGELLHGPNVNFSVTDNLSFSTSFFMWHLFLGPVDPLPAEYAGSKQLQAQASTDAAVRHFTNFNLSVSYQVTKPLSLTFGVSSFGGQLGDNGQFVFPLFNRSTSVFLDAAIDVEAALNAFL